MGRLRIQFGWEQGFFGVPPDTPLNWRGETHPLLLPFYYCHKYVPFFSIQRYPTRFQILLSLALAVLYGFGLSQWMEKLRSKFSIFLVGITALALLGFEYMHPPAPLYRQSVSQFYKRLGQDPRDFAILPVPLSPIPSIIIFRFSMGRKS